MDRTPRLHAAPLLAGVGLLVVFARVGSVLGYQAGYGPPLPPYHKDVPISFVWVTGGEFRLWLAHLVLVVPAALLIGWGLAPRLAPAMRGLARRVDAATRRDWIVGALVVGACLIAYSVLGRGIVLLDRPITDDENAATFGAKVLASGQLTVPLLEPRGAFNDMFTFVRDGRTSSFDFPGVLGFGAAAIASGLGKVLYALACAISALAVAYAAGRWFGARARVIAAALWIASPMISSLSLTTHGHVPSRMFLALVLAFASRLDTDAGSPRRDAILIGVFAGLAFLCRPFEMLVVLLPLGLYLVARSIRRGADLPRSTSAWMLAGLVPSILLFALYNLGTTGVWYLQARFAPGVIGGNESLAHTPWDRLGFNLGWNALMLAVFALGIPAIAAIVGGLDRGRPITLVLGAGALGGFLLCLAHDNTGIHSVGPIHLSEVVVIVVLLATAGLVRAFAWLSRVGIAQASIAVVVAAYLAIACGVLCLTNLASLRMQATTQAAPDELLAELGVHHAVVVSLPFVVLIQANKEFAPHGSWVLEYPHPSPDLSDDVIYVRGNTKLSELARAFPTRSIYRMTYHKEAPAIRVELLHEPPVPPN